MIKSNVSIYWASMLIAVLLFILIGMIFTWKRSHKRQINHLLMYQAAYEGEQQAREQINQILEQKEKEIYHKEDVENSLKEEIAYLNQELQQANMEVQKQVNFLQTQQNETDSKTKEINTLRYELDKLKETHSHIASLITQEIASPLQIIFAYQKLDELIATLDTQWQGRFVGIQKAMHRIKSYIEDIQIIQQSQNNELVINFSEHNLSQITQNAIDNLSPFIQQKEIQIQNYIGAQQNGLFDAFYIQKVFENLLSYIIDHAAHAGVLILESKPYLYKGKQHLMVFITDTSGGMKGEAFKNNIAYNQVGNANTFLEKSTLGVRLDFCKVILEAHHCPISLGNLEGVITTISIVLPSN